MTAVPAPTTEPSTPPVPHDELSLTVGYPELAAALTDLKPFVPTRAPVPVLGGVLLTNRDGELRASVFDYETAASVELSGAAVTGGAALVSYAEVSKALAAAAKGESKKNLASLRVDLTVRPTPHQPGDLHRAPPQAELGVAGFTVPITAHPVADYPAIPELGDPAFTVDRVALTAALRRTSVATGEDHTLPMLTGVQWRTGGGQLTLAATDRYRLAVAEVPVTGELPAEVLLPATALAAASRMTGEHLSVSVSTSRRNGHRSSNTEIYVDQVGISDGRLTAVLRTVDALFPPYRRLAPVFDGAVVLDRAELARTVMKAAALTAALDGIYLSVDAAPGGLVVSPGVGEGRERALGARLGATTEGELSLEFTPGYLSDGLSCLDGARVRIQFVSGALKKPVLLDDPDAPGFTYLLMSAQRSTAPHAQK